MNSYDYSKLTETPHQQQLESNITEVIVQQQPNQQFTTQDEYPPPRWGWGTLTLSICSMCCCPLLGFCATVMSILSYVDHKSKDYIKYQNKKHHSRNLAASGIVISVVVTAAGFMVFYMLVLNTSSTEGLESAVNQIGNDIHSSFDTPVIYRRKSAEDLESAVKDISHDIKSALDTPVHG